MNEQGGRLGGSVSSLLTPPSHFPQAIARVHRVFRDKQSGLIVDYLGLADQLKQAVATRLLHLLIEQVDYDGRDGSLSITFHACGLKTLAGQRREDAA